MTDAELLAVGMYDGDKDNSGIECHSKRVVTTRSPHKCPGNFSGELHDIPIGTRAVYEHALVDGKWGSCWTCEACIEKYLTTYCGAEEPHS